MIARRVRRLYVALLLGTAFLSPLNAQMSPERIYEQVMEECKPPSFLHYAATSELFTREVEKMIADLPQLRTRSGIPNAESRAEMASQLRARALNLVSQVEAALTAADQKLKAEIVDHLRFRKAADDATAPVHSPAQQTSCPTRLNNIGYPDIFLRMNKELSQQVFALIDDSLSALVQMMKEKGWD